MTQRFLGPQRLRCFSGGPREIPDQAELNVAPSKFSLSASALRDQQQFSGNLPRFHVAMRLRCLR